MNKLIKFLAILFMSTLNITCLYGLKDLALKLSVSDQLRVGHSKEALFQIISGLQPANTFINGGFFSYYGWLLLVPFEGFDQAIPIENFFEKISLGYISLENIEKLDVSKIPYRTSFKESYIQVRSYYLYQHCKNTFKIETILPVPTKEKKIETLKYLFNKYKLKFLQLEKDFKKHFRQFLKKAA